MALSSSSGAFAASRPPKSNKPSSAAKNNKEITTDSVASVSKRPRPSPKSQTSNRSGKPGSGGLPTKHVSGSHKKKASETTKKLDAKNKDKSEKKVLPVKTKKDERAAAKKKLLQRKMAKSNYEVIVDMKKIWEELRRHKLPGGKRVELCEQLQEMIKGKEKEFSKAHDTCRIVQCLYKYGNEAQRTTLFESLKDAVVDMAKSKYSVYLVKKMLKVGTKSQKAFIIESFMREARKLLKHRIAGHMVEYIYNMYANAAQRAVYSRQFYGPAYVLTSARVEDGATPARPLGPLLAAEPHRRQAVARHLKEVLEAMVRKESLAYTLVHELFLDYFMHATVGNDGERQAMAEVLQEHIPHLAHTREGAKVGAYCIWFGTTKVRKAIIKSLKPHVEKMCSEEFSPIVFYAIFDVVDDTQLVQKVVLHTISRILDCLMNNQYGRKVLHYLLNPRDPAHFPREVADFLSQGDSNPVSKKEQSRRHEELVAFISPALIQHVAQNMATLVADNASLLVVENVLLHAAGDVSPATRSFIQAMAAPFTANCGHLIENTACHIVMKKLIADDCRKLKAGCERTGLFTYMFLSVLPAATLRTFTCCNRGCFIFLSMMKIEDDEVLQKVKDLLKPVLKQLKTKTFLGAKHLLEQMKV